MPEVKKTYKYLDAQTFEPSTIETTVAFAPASDVTAAMARLGNDSAAILKALNDHLLGIELSIARREALSGRALSKKVLFKVLSGFRDLGMDGVPEVAAKDTVSKAVRAEQRKAQTAALIEFVRSNPKLMTSIKTRSEEVFGLGEDEDEDSDDDA